MEACLVFRKEPRHYLPLCGHGHSKSQILPLNPPLHLCSLSPPLALLISHGRAAVQSWKVRRGSLRPQSPMWGRGLHREVKTSVLRVKLLLLSLTHSFCHLFLFCDLLHVLQGTYEALNQTHLFLPKRKGETPSEEVSSTDPCCLLCSRLTWCLTLPPPVLGPGPMEELHRQPVLSLAKLSHPLTPEPPSYQAA